MIPGRRGLAILAGLAGLSGVVMAALGGHVESLTQEVTRWRAWQSATSMHLLHAVALAAMAALAHGPGARLLGAGGLLMAFGIVLFSGSIYARILAGAESGFGMAPVGGISLMAGWLLLVLAAARRR